MDRQALLALFDREQRRDIEFPDMDKQVLPHVIRFVRPAPGMSFILYSDLGEAEVERVAGEQIAYFEEREQPFEWKVYAHDKPADLRDRLDGVGFEAEAPEAVMVLDLQGGPAELLTTIHMDNVAGQVRQIETREGLADVVYVEEQVWGREFDWIYDRLGSHLAIPGYLSVYVAYVAEQPAAAAWIYFHPGSKQFASIWGGSTVERFRNRGLYTALLAARAREARRRGYRFLTVDAGPNSRPILQRHGFELLTHAHACKWPMSRTSGTEGNANS